MINASAARWPEPLAPGARVALVAPAGPLRGDGDLQRAMTNVRTLGWEPVIAEHVLARDGYFAGDDATRVKDLIAAMRDPHVDGIWCARGGYGSMRLLRAIDYEGWTRAPKALLGFSDITALHAALGARSGVVSYHAPTARQPLTEFSHESLSRAVTAQVDSCGIAPGASVITPGTAQGRLAGGNLAVLTALCGTPFFPSLDGAILILEDINEAVYRIDRMLHQLLLAGALDGCTAIGFGQCTSCPEESDDGARTLDAVLAEVAGMLRIPCIAGLPIGHIPDQWTLPLGAMAEIDVEGRTLRIVAPNH